MERSPFGDFDLRSILQSLRRFYEDAVSRFKPGSGFLFLEQVHLLEDNVVPAVPLREELPESLAVHPGSVSMFSLQYFL